jgi:hypothetical protein
LVDVCLSVEKMCRYGLKMNTLKCVFHVSSKFLGFIFHEHGIAIGPKKVEAIRTKLLHAKKEL